MLDKSRPSSSGGTLQAILWAAGVFLAWRGSLLVFDFVAINLTPMMGRCREQWEVFGEGHYWLNGLFRWDGGWYRAIALRGYSFHEDRASSVAFYPLYPYLSRYLGLLVGGPFVAGMLISSAATVGAIYHLRRLGELLFDARVGHLSTVFLLVFPSSLFLSAFYSESLFICLSCASMLYYLRARYLVAGCLGFFAMLTRSTGLVLFAALGADLCWQLYRRRTPFRWQMLALLLIPAGLGTFMLILQWQVGDPLAFTKAVEHWGREQSWPWSTVFRVLEKIRWSFPRKFENMQALVDVICALSFLALGGWMAARKYPVALWSFVLIGTLLPLSTTNIASMNRYVLSLFPAFLFLAEICQKRPELERYLIFAFAFFLAIYSTRFMQCGWAG